MKNKDIGQQLASLNHLIKRNLQNELSSELMRISAANGYILVYLYENKQNDVFQRDLEEYFNITRSTASKVLSLKEGGSGRRREAEKTCHHQRGRNDA